jgi:signal transduction histidine kinase
MKNSLGFLLNTLDEVVGDCAPAECPSYQQFAKLQYEAKRVNNDLIQLLTLYKIDNSQYSANVIDYPVGDFLEENILQNKPLLDFHSISIEKDCPDDLDWFFDRDLLSGVVNNVLNNAIKYTKGRLRLSADERDGYLVITIEDDGRGYPESMLHAAGPKQTVSFQSGSTGLGLYFAAMVAKLHRNREREGFIQTANGGAFGGGCFSIHLP